MTKKQIQQLALLKKLISACGIAPTQQSGVFASNSSVKFHEQLHVFGSIYDNVFAVWAGSCLAFGSYSDILEYIDEQKQRAEIV